MVGSSGVEDTLAKRRYTTFEARTVCLAGRTTIRDKRIALDDDMVPDAFAPVADQADENWKQSSYMIKHAYLLRLTRSQRKDSKDKSGHQGGYGELANSR